MTASNVVPIRPLPGTRPEVVELAVAVAQPLEGFAVDGALGRVVVLDHGLATDLLGLIADLCPDHVTCSACGEAGVCTPCGLGSQSEWCWAPTGGLGPLCPDCKAGACARCGMGEH